METTKPQESPCSFLFFSKALASTRLRKKNGKLAKIKGLILPILTYTPTAWRALLCRCRSQRQTSVTCSRSSPTEELQERVPHARRAHLGVLCSCCCAHAGIVVAAAAHGLLHSAGCHPRQGWPRLSQAGTPALLTSLPAHLFECLQPKGNGKMGRPRDVNGIAMQALWTGTAGGGGEEQGGRLL